MRQEVAQQVCLWFEEIERQLIEVLKVIPPYGSNLQAWSPRLASVISESCQLVGSLFSSPLPQSVSVGGKQVRRDRMTIDHFRELYAAKLRLPERRAILTADLPGLWLVPYSSWGFPNPQAPSWWATHNDMKHSRLDSYSRSTIQTAVDAASGALIAISSMQEMLDAIIGREWFNMNNRSDPEVVKKLIREDHLHHFTVETALFIVPITNQKLPETIADLSSVLFGSRRLATYLGRLT